MSWLSRFLNVGRRDQVNRDLDEEIRFHLAACAEDLTRAGMTPEKAEAQARRRFGHALLVRESSGDVKLFARLESILQDAAFGLRLCRKNAILTGAANAQAAVADGSPDHQERVRCPGDVLVHVGPLR